MTLRWAAARPFKYSSDGPRPARPIKFQRMDGGPAQPIAFSNFHGPARPGPLEFQICRPRPAHDIGGAAHKTRALYGPVRHFPGPAGPFNGPGHGPAHGCAVLKGEGICADDLFHFIFSPVFFFLLEAVGQPMSHAYQLPPQFCHTNGPPRLVDHHLLLLLSSSSSSSSSICCCNTCSL